MPSGKLLDGAGGDIRTEEGQHAGCRGTTQAGRRILLIHSEYAIYILAPEHGTCESCNICCGARMGAKCDWPNTTRTKGMMGWLHAVRDPCK